MIPNSVRRALARESAANQPARDQLAGDRPGREGGGRKHGARDQPGWVVSGDSENVEGGRGRAGLTLRALRTGGALRAGVALRTLRAGGGRIGKGAELARAHHQRGGHEK